MAKKIMMMRISKELLLNSIIMAKHKLLWSKSMVFLKLLFPDGLSNTPFNGETLTAKQIQELQKRNAQLEEENLILKKAIAIFTPHSNKD